MIRLFVLMTLTSILISCRGTLPPSSQLYLVENDSDVFCNWDVYEGLEEFPAPINVGNIDRASVDIAQGREYGVAYVKARDYNVNIKAKAIAFSMACDKLRTALENKNKLAEEAKVKALKAVKNEKWYSRLIP